MTQFRPALALSIAGLILGCSTPAPAPVPAPDDVAIAQTGNQPANPNPFLRVVEQSKEPGAVRSVDEVVKRLNRARGTNWRSLPKTSTQTTLRVKLHHEGAMLQLLGVGRHLLEEETEAEVGMGAEMPAEQEAALVANPVQANSEPLLEAASAGAYQLAQATPAIWDLRDHTEGGTMPAIRNQGQRGTCVFHSTCGYLDYLYRIQNPAQGTSPQFMYWLYHLEVMRHASPELAFKNVGTNTVLWHPCLTNVGNRNVRLPSWPYIPPNQGALSEQEVPYQPTNGDYTAYLNDFRQLAGQALGDGVASKIAANGQFNSRGARFFSLEATVKSFEAAIAGGQPIQAAFPCVPEDWYDPLLVSVPALDAAGDKHYNAYNFRQTGTRKYSAIAELTPEKEAKASGHSVLLTGYVRDASAPGGGWFILRNSWSADWADGGYAMISYASCMKYIYSSYVATTYSPFQAHFTVEPPPDEAPPLNVVVATPTPAPQTPPPATPTPTPQPTPTPEPSDEPTPRPTATPSISPIQVDPNPVVTATPAPSASVYDVGTNFYECETDWTAFDTDGNGKLDVEEYVAGRYRRYNSYRLENPNLKTQIMDAFRVRFPRLDVNGDGFLNQAEFFSECAGS